MGGRNGRAFRVTNEQADLAVKLTARDRYDRAGREYHASKALAEAGLASLSQYEPYGVK